MKFKDMDCLAGQLLGTCSTFDYDEHELSDDQIRALDERILKCDWCGWWVETHECTGNGEIICSDCRDE